MTGPLNVHLIFENFFQALKPFAGSVPLYQLSGKKQRCFQQHFVPAADLP